MTEEKQKSEEVQKQDLKEENKTETKKPEVKKENKVKKIEACVKANSLSISPKVGVHICNMIRNKSVDKGIKMLEEVKMFKRAVKMNNMEIGHRPGKGMMAGRYPQNASDEFLRLLKGLKANAIHNELELEKSVISECYTNVASKPYKRGGARFKRANVFIKLEQKEKKKTAGDKK